MCQRKKTKAAQSRIPQCGTGRYTGNSKNRRSAAALWMSCDAYEVTSAMDTDCVCGGHRGSGAMAGDAEVVGGRCGIRSFGWRNFGGGISAVAALRGGGVGCDERQRQQDEG